MTGKAEDDTVPLPLCASSALEEGGSAHVWDVLEYGRPQRAFVLRFDGVVRAYINRCLHVPVELDWQPNPKTAAASAAPAAAAG